MIHTWALNPEYSFRADQIHVPTRPLLQGGMKFWINSAEKVPRITLATYILPHHKNIELYLDFLYEQNNFPTSKVIQDHLPYSKKLYFKEHKNIIKEPHTVTNSYKPRVFNINVYHRDHEFNMNA